jgi:hypothetical protein
MTLVPAYGRDYKSVKEVKAAFEAGNDFEIASIGPDCGRYVNRPQLVGLERSVMIRYAKLTKVVEVKV